MSEIISSLSIFIYQYYLLIKKDFTLASLKKAYTYAHKILAEVGIVQANYDNNLLTLIALDPMALLSVEIRKQSSLWYFVSKKIKELYGCDITIIPYTVGQEGVPVYKYTKPFIDDCYEMATQEVMSWTEIFNLDTLYEE